MNIGYITFDSFGVKSMCTFVKTDDISIVIDPGIAWETNSFPLPFVMKAALDAKYANAIKKACKKSDIIIITHYHYDHYIPDDVSPYKDKILLIKDHRNNINRSQKNRSKEFFKTINNKPKKIEIADNKTFKFGKTKIKFSKALWHGMKGTGLGFIIMVTINDGKKN